MRVLVTSFAYHTHYYHLVPLAWALRAAGHEVLVASQPRLTDAITASGLPAAPVGDDRSVDEFIAQARAEADAPAGHQRGIDFTEARPEVLTWDYLLAEQEVMTSVCFAPLNCAATIAGMVALARSWEPDLVIWEAYTYAGAIAAHAVGAAHGRLLWGPDVVGRSRQRFLRRGRELPPAQRKDPMADWLRHSLGLAGVPAAESDVEELLHGQWAIDPTPEKTRFALPTPAVPMRFVPYNAGAVVPDWLHEAPERSRVCLTLGLSGRDTGGQEIGWVQELLTSLGELDVEVVATLDQTQQEQLTAVPANTRMVDYVPMDALLPTCAAVIHPGGAGTWATAILHGVPQIVIGDVWDAPLKGRQLADLAAGIHLPPAGVNGASLREALRQVLEEPRLRRGAEILRTEMAGKPTPAETVATLERLTSVHRKPR
ncbi:activator-dependent family glycosyltransferase [Streptomyces sp. A30]|uniref:activator-dependent family glycosyltransferase n=1 Tax=Streptomyces sp. A30 TaxID=2789273 RepID=UPI00397F1288